MEAPPLRPGRGGLRNTLRRITALVDHPAASDSFLQGAQERLRIGYLDLVELFEQSGGEPLAGGTPLLEPGQGKGAVATPADPPGAEEKTPAEGSGVAKAADQEEGAKKSRSRKREKKRRSKTRKKAHKSKEKKKRSEDEKTEETRPLRECNTHCHSCFGERCQGRGQERGDFVRP